VQVMVFVSVFPGRVLQRQQQREDFPQPLAMWVWIETSTPLLFNCAFCRVSLWVGSRSFRSIFNNKIFNDLIIVVTGLRDNVIQTAFGISLVNALTTTTSVRK
jgi:hypothetical protein